MARPPAFGGRNNLNRPVPEVRVSEKPTPYLVHCREHGQVFLTEAEYTRQMDNPDNGWTCPHCGADAGWDDDNYESYLPPDLEGDPPDA